MKPLPFVIVAAATAIAVASIVLTVLNLNRADVTEGLTLAMSMRWSVATPDLTWLIGFPHTSIAYGPEYPWLVKMLGRLFPDASLLILGRAISLAAGAGVLTMIVVAVRRAGRTIADVWLAAFVFLTAPLVMQLWWQARVEPLAIFWTVLAYAAVSHRHGPSLAALCLVLGSLTKQTVAFHAIPLGVWFLATSSRPYWRFWIFVGASAIGGLAAWLPVVLAFDGFFWQSAVTYHGLKQTSPWRGYVLLYSYLPSITMAASIAAAARAALTRPFAQSLADRWWLGFVFSLVADTVMLMKDGSWTHYALPSLVFGAILLGRHAREMVGGSVRAAPWLLAAVSVVGILPAFVRVHGLNWRPEVPVRPAFVHSAVEQAGSPAYVLTDGDITPLLDGTKSLPMVADSFALKVLDSAGRIDLTPLLTAIRAGTLEVVLLDRTIAEHRSTIGEINQLWPAGVIEALADRYVETASAPGIHVYRPRR